MCTPAVAQTDQEAEPASKLAILFFVLFFKFCLFFSFKLVFFAQTPPWGIFSVFSCTKRLQAVWMEMKVEEPWGQKTPSQWVKLVGSAPSRSITQVDCELDSPPVQLQAQRVGRLLRGGGHQQPEGPLGHEAEGHVLGLRVHRPGQDHLQVHAAVVAHHSGVCTEREREREPTAPHPHPPGEIGGGEEGGSRDIN